MNLFLFHSLVFSLSQNMLFSIIFLPSPNIVELPELRLVLQDPLLIAPFVMILWRMIRQFVSIWYLVAEFIIS